MLKAEEILKKLCDNTLKELTESEIKLYLVIIRKTLCCCKESRQISSQELSQATGMCLAGVRRAKRTLTNLGLIHCEEIIDSSGANEANAYSLMAGVYDGAR